MLGLMKNMLTTEEIMKKKKKNEIKTANIKGSKKKVKRGYNF